LGHPSSYQPFATTATTFRLILISSPPQKTPARSGGLKLPLESTDQVMHALEIAGRGDSLSELIEDFQALAINDDL
jgi:hypothetical protein